MAVFSTSLSGMNAAQTWLQSSDHNVANMNTDGFKCQNTRLAVVELRGALTGRSSYGSKNQSTHAIGTRGSAANAG